MMLSLIIGVGAIGTGIYAIYSFSTTQETALGGDSELNVLTFGDNAIAQATIEFNAKELASGAQDAVNDYDLDILEWNPDRNDDLVAKHYLDCTGVVPAEFDGKNTFVDVTAANNCVVNTYKFWQSFTAGDSESKLAEELVKTASDLDDVDGSGTTTTVVKTNKIYLVTLTEGADADEDDVIPMAFLIRVGDTTVYDAEDIADGSIKIRFEVPHYSDATADSKVQLSGVCEDDEENSVNLDSSLNGFVHSSLTTATTISADCDVDVEVTTEGYALKLENSLATSNSERSYLLPDPYGTNGSAWVKYGSATLSGDVGFDSSPSGDAIIWEGLDVCGAVITDDSTTDSVKLGGEKLYAESYSCIKDLFHTGGADPSITIPVHVSEIKVDYNAATNGSSGILEAASGSSPEAIVDLSLVGLEASTDIIGQAIAG